jgi:hypothetical protein
VVWSSRLILVSSCTAPSLTRGLVSSLQCNLSLVRVMQDP